MDIERILHLTGNGEHHNINPMKQCLKSKPVIVFMVAPWCGHCQRLEPTINTLENELIHEPEFDKLHMMKVHDTELDKLGMKAKSYPTIRLFMNGKHIKDHEGSREPSDIKSFLRKHMKIHRGSKNIHSGSKKKRCSKNKNKYSKRLGSDKYKTYKLKKKGSYKIKDYKGKNHKDPRWLEETFGIVGGGKSKKKKRCKCTKKCNSKCTKKRCKCNKKRCKK